MKLRSTIESEIDGVQYNIRKLMEELETLEKELVEAKEREPDQIVVGSLLFKRQEISFYCCEEEDGIEFLCSQDRNGKFSWLCYVSNKIINCSAPHTLGLPISSDTLAELKTRLVAIVQGTATALQTLADKLKGRPAQEPLPEKY